MSFFYQKFLKNVFLNKLNVYHNYASQFCMVDVISMKNTFINMIFLHNYTKFYIQKAMKFYIQNKNF